MYFRTGIGYDVHQLRKTVPLVLGGVEIDSEFGCISNSDGDVLIHALIDSLLGATCNGDIGNYFPPDDSSYKSASSIDLLRKSLEIIGEIEIVNLDCIVVAQKPKLSPYRDRIQNNIADVCNIDKNRVNVKFKTEEHMGFTGSLEGVKAIATCLISL